MAIKNFILDTNVLIHFPRAMYEFADNRVVIPIKVIEELDKIKTYGDERARNAREVTRELDKFRGHGQLSKGAEMPNKGILQVIILKHKKAIKGLQEGHADNELIQTCLQIIEEQKSKPEADREKVIFVTKDLNARIKADSLGIETQDFEKQKVSIDELYTGHTVIQVSRETIDSFYENKFLPNDFGELYPNEFIMLANQENGIQSALSKYDHQQNGLKPLDYDSNQEIWGIRALNKEQRFAFDALLDDRISLVSLIGQAGTGKTLVALACGLYKTIDEKRYKKLIVGRPIIPMGKDLGYLPGTKDEKLHLWMQPIFDNLEFIFSRNPEGIEKSAEEALRFFTDRRIIELEALTYIRGRSISHALLIIDEAQNLTPHEIKTIISRAGIGTKIILTGDPYQIDNPYLDSNSNGLTYSAERLKSSPLFASITLSKSERSELATLATEYL